jgi:hypothetical protein
VVQVTYLGEVRRNIVPHNAEEKAGIEITRITTEIIQMRQRRNEWTSGMRFTEIDRMGIKLELRNNGMLIELQKNHL